MTTLEFRKPTQLEKGSVYTIVLKGERDYSHQDLIIEYEDPDLKAPQRRSVTQVGRVVSAFKDLKEHQIRRNYDPAVKDKDTLFLAMQGPYPGLSVNDIVTVIEFLVGEDAR